MGVSDEDGVAEEFIKCEQVCIINVTNIFFSIP